MRCSLSVSSLCEPEHALGECIRPTHPYHGAAYSSVA